MGPKRKENRFRGYNVEKWVIIVIAILLCSVFCYCIWVFTSSLINKLIYIQDSGALITVQLLEAGLTIISIAVTVWAALNIVNALNRKDIQDAKNTIDELEAKTKTLDNDVQVYRNVMKTASKRTFLLALLDGDRADRFLYDQLTGEEDLLDAADYDALTQIEQLFHQAKAMHKSADGADQDLINLVDRMKALVLVKEKTFLQEPNSLRNHLLYLLLRKAGAYFYRGYAHNKTKPANDKDSVFALDAVFDFSCAAALYTEIIQIMEEMNFDQLPAYYSALGTLGEAYSKILERHNSPQFKEQLENKACRAIKAEFMKSFYLSKANASDVINPFTMSKEDYSLIRYNALFYCKRAVDYKEEEVSCRNLACAYERAAAMDFPTSPENVKEKNKFLENALLYYKKSLSFSIAQALPEPQVLNIYKATTTFYHRLIRYCVFGDAPADEYTLHVYFTEKESLDEKKQRVAAFPTINDLKETVSIRVELHYPELSKYIPEFFHVTSLAVQDMPRYKLHNTMYSFSMLWIILLRSIGFDFSDNMPNNKALLDEVNKRILELRLLGLDEQGDDFFRAVVRQYNIFQSQCVS